MDFNQPNETHSDHKGTHEPRTSRELLSSPQTARQNWPELRYWPKVSTVPPLRGATGKALGISPLPDSVLHQLLKLAVMVACVHTEPQWPSPQSVKTPKHDTYIQTCILRRQCTRHPHQVNNARCQAQD